MTPPYALVNKILLFLIISHPRGIARRPAKKFAKFHPPGGLPPEKTLCYNEVTK